MQHVLGFAILMLFGSVYTAATISWLAAAYYLFKTIANKRPEVLLWSRAQH